MVNAQYATTKCSICITNLRKVVFCLVCLCTSQMDGWSKRISFHALLTFILISKNSMPRHFFDKFYLKWKLNAFPEILIRKFYSTPNTVYTMIVMGMPENLLLTCNSLSSGNVKKFFDFVESASLHAIHLVDVDASNVGRVEHACASVVGIDVVLYVKQNKTKISSSTFPTRP